MTYRLAIDMGATSLGWCVLDLDKEGCICGLLDMGVRIFPDGRDAQSKEPLAVSRRGARGMSRRRDRYKGRRRRLMDYMIETGLMPKDKEAQKQLELKDPYELRARAAGEEITLHELGRALFHINQRRGFRSNLKTDSEDKEQKAMGSAIESLSSILENQNMTLGQYLHQRRGKGQSLRIRPHMNEKGTQVEFYDFYADRQIYRDEVRKILKMQQSFHPELTGEICLKIENIIFYQRPMKSKKEDVGECTFEEGEKRARKALPTTEYFRILQEINHLELIRHTESDPKLTYEDRRKIIEALDAEPYLSFAQIRKLLGLSRESYFNLEKSKRQDYRGNHRNKIWGNRANYWLSREDCFGERWRDLEKSEQEEIIGRLFEEAFPEKLQICLTKEWQLSEDQAKQVISQAVNGNLPDGYSKLSGQAIRKISEELENGLENGTAYDKACEAVYGDHRAISGKKFDRLPYYGQVLRSSVVPIPQNKSNVNPEEAEFGKLTNPRVHIALNQVRKLVNALIDIYGKPDQVVIELARDLKAGTEELNEMETMRQRNERDNERIKKRIQQDFSGQIRPSSENILKYKLWEELSSDPKGRCCPYTGEPIGPSVLFSDRVEIEHILPISKTFLDNRANLTLSLREANRFKKNRTPYEAFHADPAVSGRRYKWEDIIIRSQNLPDNKSWRFQPDAMKIAEKEGEDIIARHLKDTQQMSKMAMKYLACLFEAEERARRVFAINGRMTGLIRRAWGLNKLHEKLDNSEFEALPTLDKKIQESLCKPDSRKNRCDHRHHAVDAFVIGCLQRWMVEKISAIANEVETQKDLENKRHALAERFPRPPIPDYRNVLQGFLSDMVISYKPDHGNAGKAVTADRPYTVAKLHEENPWGVVGEYNSEGENIFAKRVPITNIKSRDNKKSPESSIESIADPVLKQRLNQALKGIEDKTSEWEKKLQRFASEHNIRRVRMHISKSAKSMAAIKDKNSKPYKFYPTGGNYCAEIYCPDKGKNAGKWGIEIISNFHAHQKGFIPQWQKDNPTAKLVMRLQINDMVAYEEEGETKICRVKKMDNSGRVCLRDHRIAHEEGDKLSWTAYINGLQKKNARKISVDITGRVRDRELTKNKRMAA